MPDKFTVIHNWEESPAVRSRLLICALGVIGGGRTSLSAIVF